MLEFVLKRALVKEANREGAWARRIEDRYAVGTLDLLFVSKRLALYAEAKVLKDIVVLPATVLQREQIKQVNALGNPIFRALVIGYHEKTKRLGFGFPGEHWDRYHTCPWPCPDLLAQLEAAVVVCFTYQDLHPPSAKRYGP